MKSSGDPTERGTKAPGSRAYWRQADMATQDHVVPFKRLLLTGAAGGVGKAIRSRLSAFADRIRVSDLPAALPSDAAPHEEVIPCDLSDKQAVDALVAGCDAVIHLGGVSVERPFEEVLEANIKGFTTSTKAPAGMASSVSSSPVPITSPGSIGRTRRSTRMRCVVPTVTTACPNRSVKTWPSSTSIATESRR